MTREALILRDASWHTQILTVGKPRGETPALGEAVQEKASGKVPAGTDSSVEAAPANQPAVSGPPRAASPDEPSQGGDECEALWFEKGRGVGYDEGFQAAMRVASEETEKRAHAIAQEQIKQSLARVQRTQEEQQSKVQDMQQQATQQREVLQRLLKQLPEAWERHFQSAEDDMLALIFETVCRILGDHAATLEGMRAILQCTLQNWHGSHPLSVHVNPEDLVQMQADVAVAQMLSAAGFQADRQSLRWVADPDVVLGGCLLRAGEGALDARLDVQLEALKSSLVQTREARRQAQRRPTSGEAGS
ncbi:FliH/SctL family protein [Acidovorax sp. NCPPB 2350]|nr:FliH/SctL family protein [Acidovorax sp. NCPPB 2350]